MSLTNQKKKIFFPKDFFWGGAVSAEQTEGEGTTKKAKTIYKKHFELDPSYFYNGIGPETTSDFMNHYVNDIKMWKQMGANSHRTSLSWARLFPKGDYANPNKNAVKFYHDMIDEMIKNGIEPFITLFHFDMPMFAYEKGSYENRDVWDDFEKYAAFVFEEYAPKVKYFTTMNEPWVPVHVGYVGTQHFPRVNDPQRAINAAYGIVMMHAKAVNYFNEKIRKKYNSKIGAIFNCQYVYPRDINNKADVDAAKYFDLFQFIGMTDAMVIGKWNEKIKPWLDELGIFPENFKNKDIAELAKIKIDLVGLNFYSPARIEAPISSNKKTFEGYFKPYNMPGRRENKFRGWEIYPEAIYDTFDRLVKLYGIDKEYMLTEYGMGVEKEYLFRGENGEIQDDYRVSFMKEHLENLNRFMNDNPKVKMIGAHVWATYDCWSWSNAYKNTYGLIEVDLKTQKRIFKKSAHFLNEISRKHFFESDYKKMEEYMDFAKVGFSKSK